jgi:hypothetical protein
MTPILSSDWMLLNEDKDGWGCAPPVAVQTVQTAVPSAESAD